MIVDGWGIVLELGHRRERLRWRADRVRVRLLRLLLLGLLLLLLLLLRVRRWGTVVVVPAIFLSKVEMTEIGRRTGMRDRRERSSGKGSSTREVGHLVVGGASDFRVRRDELLGLSRGNERRGRILRFRSFLI